jgi:hypothetical protein
LLAGLVVAGLALLDFTTYVQTGTSPLYAWAAANREAGGATGVLADSLARTYEEMGKLIDERLPLLQANLDRISATWDKTAASVDRLAQSLGLGSNFIQGFTEGALAPLTKGLDAVVFAFDLWSLGVIAITGLVNILLGKLGELADWLTRIEEAAPGSIGDASRLVTSGGNLLGGFARGQIFNPGAALNLGQSAANLLTSPNASATTNNKTANNTANINQTFVVNGDPAALAQAARQGAGGGASDFFAQQAQNFTG